VCGHVLPLLTKRPFYFTIDCQEILRIDAEVDWSLYLSLSRKGDERGIFPYFRGNSIRLSLLGGYRKRCREIISPHKSFLFTLALRACLKNAVIVYSYLSVFEIK
jgi:hypothetical protein